MSRHARQMQVPGVGEAGQARIAAAHVLIVGAGGLGCAAIPALAAAGVGRLTIVDPDRVELSNLHRQTLFTDADIGRRKAEAASARAARLNPDGRADAVIARLDPANAPALAATADLVIDCADNFATSYMLSDLCLVTGQPLISASVLGQSGYAGGFCGGAPSLRAVFPDLPAQAGSCATAGVLGPAVAALGAVQAQMALSVLIGLAPSPLGRIVTLDMGAWHFGGFSFLGAPEAGGYRFIVSADLRPGDTLIDLRPADSGAAAAGALVGPDLDAMPLPPGRVVLCCSTGLRAWRGAGVLTARGAAEVVLLADGR